MTAPNTHGSVSFDDLPPVPGPAAEEKSLGELVGEAMGEVSTLVRKEVELAKIEVKEEAQKAGKAGGMLGAAAATGWLTLVFASFALAWLLDDVMPRSLAFFLVAVVFGVAAAVLGTKGKAELKRIHPVPQQTVETLKEDVEWLRTQQR